MPKYPEDAILVARGKYATLGSERRKYMKQLHGHMNALTDQARAVLRFDDDAELALSFFEAMQGRMDDARGTIGELTTLQHELDELKPIAWSKDGD